MVAWSRRDLWWLVALVVALVLDTNLLDRRSAGRGDGRDITIVGVDTCEDLAAARLDVLDVDLASPTIAFACGVSVVSLQSRLSGHVQLPHDL